jgi:tetratricopeptide (TPR) repeat protein
VRFVQRSVAIDSTSDAAQLLLAEAYWCSDSPDRACEIYHKMENKSGRFPRILKKLSTCYENEDNTRLALAMLKSYLIATGDASASVFSDIGRLYYGMSRFDSALVYFNRALQRDSTLANTYYNLGLACYQLEKYSVAEHALRKAVELTTSGVDFYITQLSTLGATYLNQNKHRQAIDVYQKAVRFNPDCIDCYYFLGTLYKKLRDDERAAYWYESFLKRAPKDEAFAGKVAQAEASLKLMGRIIK